MLVAHREMTQPRQDEFGVEAHGLTPASLDYQAKLHRSLCTLGEREISGGFALLKSGGKFSVRALALSRRDARCCGGPASTKKDIFDERLNAEEQHEDDE